MIEAQFEICRGQGNGMYTLRSFTGYDRDDNEIFSYVKTLARNPHKALEKAREYSKLAIQKHNYDIEIEYHNKLAKKENQSMFGFEKAKKLRYG